MQASDPLVGDRRDPSLPCYDRCGRFGVNQLIENVSKANARSGIALNSASGNTLLNNVSMENGAAGFDLLLSNSNTLGHNLSQRNAQGGFYLAGSSNNELSQNVANGNTGVGFNLFDNSTSNVLIKNGAHGNSVVDSYDPSGGNTWNENKFGTSLGI